jgi:hypothetical protein
MGWSTGWHPPLAGYCWHSAVRRQIDGGFLDPTPPLTRVNELCGDCHTGGVRKPPARETWSLKRCFGTVSAWKVRLFPDQPPGRPSS